ncbi:hypothetical protein VST35_33140, partial [Pseudomonas aeruginosa]
HHLPPTFFSTTPPPTDTTTSCHTLSLPHAPAIYLHLYIDWPTNRVVPHLVREAVDAIRQWEPRVTVQQVLTDIDASSITLRVQWSVANGVLQQTEVPYARSSTA